MEKKSKITDKGENIFSKLERAHKTYQLVAENRNRFGKWLWKNKISQAEKNWEDAFCSAWKIWKDTEKTHQRGKETKADWNQTETVKEVTCILSLYSNSPEKWREEVWEKILKPNRDLHKIPIWFKTILWANLSKLSESERAEIKKAWQVASVNFLSEVSEPDILLNYSEHLSNSNGYTGKSRLKASFDIISRTWKPDHLKEVYGRIKKPWLLSIPACEKILEVTESSKDRATMINQMSGPKKVIVKNVFFITLAYQDNDRIKELEEFWHQLSLQEIKTVKNMREARAILKKSPPDFLAKAPEIAKILIQLIKNYLQGRFTFDLIRKSLGSEHIGTSLALAEWSPFLKKEMSGQKIPLTELERIWETLPASGVKETILEFIQCGRLSLAARKIADNNE